MALKQITSFNLLQWKEGWNRSACSTGFILKLLREERRVVPVQQMISRHVSSPGSEHGIVVISLFLVWIVWLLMQIDSYTINFNATRRNCMHSLFSFSTRLWRWGVKDMFVFHFNVVLFHIDANTDVGRDIRIFLSNTVKERDWLDEAIGDSFFLKIMDV
jgi:hypothetical protein